MLKYINFLLLLSYINSQVTILKKQQIKNQSFKARKTRITHSSYKVPLLIGHTNFWRLTWYSVFIQIKRFIYFGKNHPPPWFVMLCGKKKKKIGHQKTCMQHLGQKKIFKEGGGEEDWYFKQMYTSLLMYTLIKGFISQSGR